MQGLVEAKLNEVLEQFSLDEDGSAMFRLKGMFTDFFGQMNQSLGIKTAVSAEADRGHVKGIIFEKDLYPVFADLGNRLGDETDFVRGTSGCVGRSKKGDYLSTLGDTCGAPGHKIVVEVKDQPLRLKDAIDELQEAKQNREAVCGIFVFARGAEPAEVGDFRRIGEDFYVTVDKDDLNCGKPVLFLDSAYRIARAMIVAAERKRSAGEVDLHLIEEQVDALVCWCDRIAEMGTKARTIQSSGKFIEQCANDLKAEMDTRLSAIMRTLKLGANASPTEGG